MISILITGDFCPSYRVEKLLELGEFEKIFGQVKPITEKVDYSIINFESPVVLEKAEAIQKTGPNLKCTKKAVEAAMYAGFDCFTLANNHFFDYGEKGVNDTLDTCKEFGIETIGGGRNFSKAAEILYIEINGKNFAFINCCEHEFSIATEKSGGSNPLNPIAQYYDIQEACRKADYVIVIVHGGMEHYQLPSQRMQETYRFFIDSGADVVINHHQHCFSGYEIYKEKPIFYGLGNFSFDWPDKRNSLWNSGYAVQFNIENGILNFSLHPYIQGDREPGVRLMNEFEYLVFISQIELLNQQIANPEILEMKFLEFANSRKKSYLLYFEVYSNRFMSALFFRGLFPSFMSKRRKKSLLNIIRCEAHRDLLIKLLKDQI